MTATSKDNGLRVTLVWTGVTFGMVSGALLSFATLTALGERVGYGELAPLLPVAVDMQVIVALIVATFATARPAVRSYAWWQVAAALLVSVLANGGEHYMASFVPDTPWWVVVAVSAIAPTASAAALHLGMLFTSRGKGQYRADSAPASAERAAAERSTDDGSSGPASAEPAAVDSAAVALDTDTDAAPVERSDSAAGGAESSAEPSAAAAVTERPSNAPVKRSGSATGTPDSARDTASGTARPMPRKRSTQRGVKRPTNGRRSPTAGVETPRQQAERIARQAFADGTTDRLTGPSLAQVTGLGESTARGVIAAARKAHQQAQQGSGAALGEDTGTVTELNDRRTA
jgi:uncharacterized protein DUF2637